MSKKIVINTCFGGFGLSPKALIYLIEMNSSLIVKSERDIDGFFSSGVFKRSLKDCGNGYVSDSFSSIVLKDDAYYSIESVDAFRDHPDLIKVVEELKEEADGSCAKLKIVEIPDDVDWEIDEYDGSEEIHEVHKSWR